MTEEWIVDPDNWRVSIGSQTKELPKDMLCVECFFRKSPDKFRDVSNVCIECEEALGRTPQEEK